MFKSTAPADLFFFFFWLIQHPDSPLECNETDFKSNFNVKCEVEPNKILIFEKKNFSGEEGDEEQQQQGGWSAAAFSELESLTCDRLLQAHVVAYSLEGPPLIYLYQTPAGHEHQPLLVNRQLADSQVAQWVEPPASSSTSSSAE